jgi:hypothetical protein
VYLKKCNGKTVKSNGCCTEAVLQEAGHMHSIDLTCPPTGTTPPALHLEEILRARLQLLLSL